LSNAKGGVIWARIIGRKGENQKEKEEYYEKVLGEPGTSLINGDPAE